ncbi:MAG: site-2 protease family protein, partial [Firmicutes bacterium]|nr:site-2 protease family protein [Bacillota bacterium]
MTILTILLFIISLGLLIVIHEFGHFTMAKIFKVYVMEFSIGFGPAILKKKKGETLYALRALPIGGYVMMMGEGSEEIPELANVPKNRSLVGIAKWKRAIIMSAGIVLNFVLAFLLFFISYFAFSQKSLTNKLVIADGSLAAAAGIKTNERIDFTEIDAGTIVATTNGGQHYFVTYVGFSSYEDSLGDAIVFSRVEDNKTIYFVPDAPTDTISFPVTILTYVSDTVSTSRDVTLSLAAVPTTTGTT